MKKLILLLAVLLLCTGCATGQPTVDADQALTQEEFKALVAKADGGDYNAQFELAGMYQNGVNVDKDSVEAYMWYTLAYANAPEKAKNAHLAQLQMLAKSMTTQEVANGQKRALDWLNNFYTRAFDE